MRAIIFANGLLSDQTNPTELLRPDDLLLAADGGARHCLRLGIIPKAVIGDFDSLSDAELDILDMAGVQLVRYPTRKDFTDLELALQYAVERGADNLLILGALGARWDQTLANLLLPGVNWLDRVRVRLLDGPQEITILRGGGSLSLEGQPGDTVSLLPLGGDAQSITTQGLEYPLNDETLYFGATRGISNVLCDTHASVTLQNGLLLCVLIHNHTSHDDKVAE